MNKGNRTQCSQSPFPPVRLEKHMPQWWKEFAETEHGSGSAKDILRFQSVKVLSCNLTGSGSLRCPSKASPHVSQMICLCCSVNVYYFQSWTGSSVKADAQSLVWHDVPTGQHTAWPTVKLELILVKMTEFSQISSLLTTVLKTIGILL